MKVFSEGVTACKEHILTGNKVTRLEAALLFGVSNLTDLIHRIRKEGFIVNSKPCTYAAVMVRINKYAHITPPIDLPIREIFFTEYWISK